MVLAIAAEMDWEVVQLDVNTVFLYAFLEEDVHVEAAPGYEKMDKDEVLPVMKLHKSLYGLAQKPRELVQDHRPGTCRSRVRSAQV